MWDSNEGKVPGHLVGINADGLMSISENKIPLQRIFDLEVCRQDPDRGDQSLINRYGFPD